MWLLVASLALAAPAVQGAPPRPSLCYQGPILEGKVNMCRAYFEKYTYDHNSGKCNKFAYGGCNGSPNLFDSLEECQSVCVRTETTEKVLTNDILQLYNVELFFELFAGIVKCDSRKCYVL